MRNSKNNAFKALTDEVADVANISRRQSKWADISWWIAMDVDDPTAPNGIRFERAQTYAQVRAIAAEARQKIAAETTINTRNDR